MSLYPIEEYVDGEHRNFKCSCGKDKFTQTKTWDQYDYLFECECGKTHHYAYGNVGEGK